MKTVDAAINKAYSLLKKSGGLSCPVYLYTKPTELNPAEYVVLNALPITGGVMQICRVNVNYHVQDLKDGIPDVAKLESANVKVLQLLESNSDSTNKIYFDLENQQIVRDSDDKNHYSNFRFKVTILN